jgi:hypothetical protein
MSQRSAQSPSTVPIGVGVLGVLVVVSGWLVIQGLPFLLGCVLDVGLVACAIAMLVPHRHR